MASIAGEIKLGKARIESGVDYLDGTKGDETSKNSFAPLFGKNNKFYGFVD